MTASSHLATALSDGKELTLDLQTLFDAVTAGQSISAEEIQHVYRLSLSVFMHTAKASTILERMPPIERRVFHVERVVKP